MRFPPAFLILLLVATGLPPVASADSDPLRDFTFESSSGAKKLAETLSGTRWLYHYGGADYTLRFDSSGQIEQLKFWPNVHWRIISPSEVLLDRPGGGVMLLRFNEDVTTFHCNDWDGKPATGSRAVEKS